MNLTAINNLIDGIRGRTLAFFSAGNQWRRRMALFLAVIGPGIITSNVDNDAGGIATYTQAGSAYGYTLLWSLIPMTIALYVSEEMCARIAWVSTRRFPSISIALIGPEGCCAKVSDTASSKPATDKHVAHSASAWDSARVLLTTATP